MLNSGLFMHKYVQVQSFLALTTNYSYHYPDPG